MVLPEEFRNEIFEILGEEGQDAFFQAAKLPAFKGIRWNPLKCTLETLRNNIPFSISPAPFSPLSFYGEEGEKVGLLPAHHAGMFYAQEPSAASAVTVLDPRPGEYVLDLCAAPGGKSSQIGALIQGSGLLWANEIVRSRAQILLSNLERLGICNAVVSSVHPEKLCEKLEGFFDKVLVDAPCSGEGMFRKEPEALKQWSPEHVKACAQRQRAILDSAAKALRPGGILVYSTCTFSRAENEETIEAFLEEHMEFSPCAPQAVFGRPALSGIPGVRIFPMDGGEGHFVAKLQKNPLGKCERPARIQFPVEMASALKKEAQTLYAELFKDEVPSAMALFGEKIYLLPEGLPDMGGLAVLRAGVEGFECKAKRLEPCHNLFMSRSGSQCRQVVDLKEGTPELLAFLRGEEISCKESLRGFAAVCLDGVTLGFGKASGGRLKNRYPKGLRNLR